MRRCIGAFLTHDGFLMRRFSESKEENNVLCHQQGSTVECNDCCSQFAIIEHDPFSDNRTSFCCGSIRLGSEAPNESK